MEHLKFINAKYERLAKIYAQLYAEGRISFQEMSDWTEELATRLLERFSDV